MLFRSIEKNIENVGEEIMSDYPFDGKSLFLRGEFSDYINRDDEFEIRQLFLKAEIKTIYGAGHWLHADKPLEFLDAIFNFLSGQ